MDSLFAVVQPADVYDQVTVLQAQVAGLKWVTTVIGLMLVATVLGLAAIKVSDSQRVRKTLKDTDATLASVKTATDVIIRHGLLTDHQASNISDSADRVKRHAEKIDDASRRIHLTGTIEGPGGQSVPVVEAPAVVIHTPSTASPK